MVEIGFCNGSEFLFLPNDKWVGRSICLYHEALHDEITLLSSFVRPGNVVLDANAHFGVVSVALAEAGADVLAVEPQEYIFNILAGNVALNVPMNVRTLRKALTNDSSKKRFLPSAKFVDRGEYFYEKDVEFEKGLEDYTAVISSDEPRSEQDVPVELTTVDELKLDELHLMRLNTGNELEVLEGAAETIQRFQPVIFVATTHWSVPKLQATIYELGYVMRSCRLKLFNADNRRGYSVDHLLDDSGFRMMTAAMLCWPKSREAELDRVYFRAMQKLQPHDT